MAVASLVELPEADTPLRDGPQAAALRSKEALGVIAVADFLFGLPIAALREVVPSPENFIALPEVSADLLGAIVLRGQTIPVRSLRAQFGLGDSGAGEVIVIVQSEGCILGLLVDRVVELVRGGATRHQPVQRDAAEKIGDRFLTTDGRVITLLDIDRLFGLPGAARDDGRDRASPAERSVHVSYLRFTADGLNFMAPLTEIAATIPRDNVLPSAVSGGLCLGVIRRHGVEMPILDTSAAFGFDPGPRHMQSAAGIALEFEQGGSVAFKVDAVRDIVRIDPAQMASIPPVVTSRSDLMSGAYLDRDGGHSFVLDVAACRAETGFVNLAAVAHRVEPTASPTQGTEPGKAQRKSVFLIVEAGVQVAIDIDEVVEVIRVPPGLLGQALPGHRRTLTHRGHLMPVSDLATGLGTVPLELTRDSAILVVGKGDHLYGWVVSRLVSIDMGAPWIDQTEGEEGTVLSEETYALFGDPAQGKLLSVVKLRDRLTP